MLLTPPALESLSDYSPFHPRTLLRLSIPLGANFDQSWAQVCHQLSPGLGDAARPLSTLHCTEYMGADFPTHHSIDTSEDHWRGSALPCRWTAISDDVGGQVDDGCKE